ncbi:MAG: ATP phosphoribosyltransferase regulatory subunit [Clostridia bacterium]|nr:ATP phosphoribosyltransferase regulatory subunit [Clostridia bacterium]
MTLNEQVLKYDERMIYDLRELYRLHGYTRFKMGKFEEYDLYSKNKDFLVSDSVITFTDTNGKLMALKPDVTLSIVKNAKWQKGCVQKVYYNENVYRISRSTHAFEELMQAGLECIGDLDVMQLCDVMLLAAQSLQKISADFVLDVSHMGIVGAMMEEMHLPADAQNDLLAALGEKNTHGARAICLSNGVDDVACDRLLQLIRTYGPIGEILPALQALCADLPVESALCELTMIAEVLASNGFSSQIRLDFSVVHDIHYYSGIVFQGFVDGIPSAVLIGGRYDRLLRKMGKQGGAVGFAVYLDLLERLHREKRDYDADVLCLYRDEDDPTALSAAVSEWNKQGKSVLLQREIPTQMRFGEIVRFSAGGEEK